MRVLCIKNICRSFKINVTETISIVRILSYPNSFSYAIIGCITYSSQINQVVKYVLLL
ncbi:hypothetical protein BD408DRAFT_248446 [Parasitella parasitica]|nr:hypothetical protein BD408DRAFT_248446 [Parasitella parasitica]